MVAKIPQIPLFSCKNSYKQILLKKTAIVLLLVVLLFVTTNSEVFSSGKTSGSNQPDVSLSSPMTEAGGVEPKKAKEQEESMAPLFFVIIALILGAAAKHFLRKSPLPYTVTLLIIGLMIGVANRFEYFHEISSIDHAIDWAGHIDPHVILFVFLPTLIFEGAFALDVHTFKKTAANALLLAIPGLLLGLFLTGALMMGIHNSGLGLSNWNWSLAFMFGALISATDPVAVVALLKELGVSKKLSTLIDGEAMLNDGTGIVLFMVFFLPMTGAMTATSPVVDFLYVSFGGVLLGLILAGISISWVKRVFNDALVEISVIVAAAYLTFYVSEHLLHVSGVIGLFALGLVMAGLGRTRISPEVEHFLHEFWGMAAFIANTLIFVLVGVVIASQAVFSASDFVVLGILYIGLHLTRALMISLFFPIMKKAGYGLNKEEAVVLWYGALRGGVGLALALVVAGVSDQYIAPDIKNQFLFLTAGIVVLTLLINATTIKAVINALGLTKILPVKALMMINAFQYLKSNTEKSIDLLRDDRFISGANWNKVREYLPQYAFPVITEGELARLDTLSETRRRMLEKEKNSYWNQFKEGFLGAQAVRRLSEGISEMLDSGGKLPLNERPYLDKLWTMPRFLNMMHDIPFLCRFAQRSISDRLAEHYDIAKGFVLAQEEIAKIVETLTGEEQRSPEIAATIHKEIHENRVRGLNYLKNLHEAYPEIAVAIETKHAIRSMLNHEKETIHRLEEEGPIEPDEAANLIVNVEARMKQLMFHPPSFKLPEPIELLNGMPWLRGLDASIINKIVSIVETKTFPTGKILVEQGGPGDGMFLIARGTVKVTVGNHLVDILGPGNVIGEMAVLTGLPRTATVTAASPVTALWITSHAMQQVLKSSAEMEERLWLTAGIRFSENILGKMAPYRQWTQINLKRWLSDGKVIAFKGGDRWHFKDSAGVLITGKVAGLDGKTIATAPAVLEMAEYVFTGDARVFVRAKQNI